MAPISATIFVSSPLTITALPSRTSSLSCTKEYQKIRHRGTVKSTTTCGMMSEADHGSGRLVDENMIVLRKRIHETKMIERNYEPPAEWMDWEKSFYTSYDSVICEAMGILQSRLMDTRPSLALGLIALVTLSVPTTTLLGMFHLMELIRVVLSGIHLG